MPRVVVYVSEGDRVVIEANPNALAYLSGRLRRECNLIIGLTKEMLVFCSPEMDEKRLFWGVLVEYEKENIRRIGKCWKIRI